MTQRPQPSTDPQIADVAPDGPTLTDYDCAMQICYVRLLDAEQDGASWQEAARIVLKIDPDKHYVRAKRMYDSHLARARWMTETGYRQLLGERDDSA